MLRKRQRSLGEKPGISYYLYGMKSKPKPVLIQWCDAITGSQNWESVEDAIRWGDTQDWVITQAGFILKETKEYILIASKYNAQTQDSDKVDGVTKIPKTWIRKRKNITSF